MHHPALVQSEYPTNHPVAFLQPLPQAALVELAVLVREEHSSWGHSPWARGPAAIPVSSWAQVVVGEIAIAAHGKVSAPHNLRVLPALYAH